MRITGTILLALLLFNGDRLFGSPTRVKQGMGIFSASNGPDEFKNNIFQPGNIVNDLIQWHFNNEQPETRTRDKNNINTERVKSSSESNIPVNGNLPLDVTFTSTDVKCYGDNTGTIDITVKDATGEVNYLWEDGATTEDRTGLIAGAYRVTVTDETGTYPQTTIVIAQPLNRLTTSENHNDILCFGSSTGSINLSVTGGTPNYTFVWTATDGGVVPTGQDNSENLTGLVTGIYNVTVTDANLCTATRSITITQPAEALGTGETHNNVLCFGSSTGSIDLSVTGGTPNYTFVWTATDGGVVPTGQDISENLTGLVAGIYNVTVTDANLCTTTRSITITQPAEALGKGETHNNVLCFGSSTGSIDLSVTGGTPNYTFVWTATDGGVVPTGQENSEDLTGLVAGTYNVTVTDANHCTATQSITITQPSAILAVAQTHNDVLCFGNSTGSIDLSVTGGTPNYIFVWTATDGGIVPTGQENSEDLTGLVAGTYNVTVTDANHCTATQSITITQPSAILAVAQTHNDVLCFGNSTGSIDLSVTGGTPNYTFVWTATDGGVVPTGQENSEDLTGLVAGTYNVIVTDANHCAATQSITITQPSATLTVAQTHNNALCFGNSTASIDLSVTGGTPNYTFVWTATDGGVVPTGQENSEDLTGLVAGTYNVTVTDANHCTASIQSIITQPTAPLSISNISSNSPVCEGTTLNFSITATGGTGSYTYDWSGPNDFASALQNPEIANVLSSMSGSYSINVKDGNNCRISSNTDVMVNPAPIATASTLTSTICSGTAPSINLSSNIAGTTFEWTILESGVSGASANSGTTIAQTLTTTGITQGTVTYTITPTANGCVGSPIKVVITVKPTPTVTATPIAQSICTQSTTSIALTSSLSGTTFNWTAVQSGVSGATDGTGEIIAQTLTTLGKATGTATYTITPAANGCNGDPVITVVTVNPIPQWTGSTSASSCSGTVFSFTPTSNIPGTNFSWTRAGVLGIQNGIASGTDNPNETLVNIGITPVNVIYNYTLNFNGCTNNQAIVATIKPISYLLSSTAQTTICSNTTFNYKPVSSITGTVISWKREAITGISNTAASGTGDISEILTNTSNADILVSYILTLSYGGCDNSQIVTVNVKPLPSVNPIADQVVCKGETVAATPLNSSVPTTTFSWTNSNPAIGLGGSGTLTIPSFVSTSNNITAPITSTISIRPTANNCIGSVLTYKITVNPLPTATISGTKTVCQNAASPVITFTGANSTAPYTFTYKINGGADQTLTTISGNSAILTIPTTTPGVNTYTLVSVKGSTECWQSQTGDAVITINPLPTGTIIGTGNVCQSDPSPTITLTGADSSSPYTFTYTLNGGPNQQIATAAGANSVSISAPTNVSGTFNYNLVSITGATGCTSTKPWNAIITVNETPTATISGTTTVCENQTAPDIIFTATGGSAPYTFTYKINNGTTQTITTTSVGNIVKLSAPTGASGLYTYSLISVSSSNGCSQLQSGDAVVTVNPTPKATISAPVTSACVNAPSPFVTFTGSDGTLPYTFTYAINSDPPISVVTTSGSSVIVPVSTLSSGSFTYKLISVADASATACTQALSGSVTVTINPLPVATISPSVSTCLNAISPDVIFTGNNASEPYIFTYKLNGGSAQTITTTSGNRVSLPIPTATAGTSVYTLVSISSNGCSTTQPQISTFVVNPLPSAAISGTTTICENGTPSAITFTGSAGTAPYTFSYKINSGSVQTITTTSGNSINLTQATTSPGTFTYNLLGVTDVNNCYTPLAESATVTVKPSPTATITTATPTVCQNSTAPKVIFTGVGGNAPYIFTYKVNGGAEQTVTATVGNSISVDVSTVVPGVFVYELLSVSNSEGCPNPQTKSATITVTAISTLSSSLTPTGICTNTVFSYTPTSATPGATFTWTRAAIPDNPASSGTGNPNELLTNSTAAAITAVYEYTISANACSNKQNVSVIVSPLPTLTSSQAPTSICSNRVFSYEPTSNLAGTTFAWHRLADPGIKVNGIANTDGWGTGNPNEALLNTTKIIKYVTYVFTLESNGCVNPITYPVVAEIKPAPLVATADKILICPNEAVDLYSSSDIVPSPVKLLSENFNAVPSGWTMTNTSNGGTKTNAAWQLRPNGYNYNGGTIFYSNDNSSFILTNSDDQGGNWGSTTNTTLSTPPINTTGYTSLTLDFWQYYNHNNGYDNAYIEASMDGSVWTNLQTYNSDQGTSPSSFIHTTINLNAYIGKPILYLRFRYQTSHGLYWAIDNVTVTGTPALPPMTWTSDPPGFTSIIPNPKGVKPTVTTTYTATYKDPDPNVECPGISSVTVVVRPEPVVTIDANYCTGNGKVRLTASAAKAWLWNTGAKTQTIEVDLAGYYEVAATDINGCIGKKSITVSNNLVVNGDFSAGNTGFTTNYNYAVDLAGRNDELWPAGAYGIGPNAYNYHSDFFGKDHTTGSGLSNDNFMIVNGKGSNFVIWEETVAVLPNTDYYFSAWTMNLNDAGNYARLQFEVNDIPVGTIAELSTAETPADNSKVRPSNWVRFYSDPLWSSGANTTAKIRIRNLRTNEDGNDFGLDDISFGTLNAVPFSATPSDNNPCEEGTLELTANVLGGTPPLTYAWTGPNFTSTLPNPTISNVTTASTGTYKLTVTDAFNCPTVGSKLVTVHPIPKVTSPYPFAICSGSPFSILPDGVPAGTIFTWTAPTGIGFTGGTAETTGQTAINQTLTNTTNSPVIASYIVTPVSGNCTGKIFNLVVTVDPVATANAGLPQTICAGTAAILNGTLGGAATSATWSATGGTFSNTNSLTSTYSPSIGSGQVILTLTSNDPAGTCPAATSTVAINVRQAPQVTYTKTDVLCNGAATGAIDITVSGGTAPYTYFWNTGAKTKDISDLNAGIYSVEVKDANGCVTTVSITITQPAAPLAASITAVENVLCTGNNSGSATVTAKGGTPGYTYEWDTNPAQTAEKGIFLVSGTYTVTVKDANGCIALTQVNSTVEVNTPPVVTKCPPTLNLNACGIAQITGLPFSAGTTPMTMTDFTTAGGAATDNCTIVKSTYSDVKSGTCPIVVTRTFTFTDAEGLTATCQQTINIDDNTPPTWVTLAHKLDRTIVFSDAVALAAAQALAPDPTDNCDTHLTNIVKTAGNYVAGECPQTGTYVNTWVVVDNCGNVSEPYTQTIYAVDKNVPVWTTAPGSLDRTVSCSDADGLAAAQALFPVATDNSDDDVSNIHKVSGPKVISPTCPNAGTYTNKWTATDDCGNVSDVFTQVITIEDNTPPVWTTFPGELDVVLECGDASGLKAAQALFPVATDNCGNPSYSIVKGAFVQGSCGATGSYTNIWTAKDECGNATATYTQVITLRDQTAPVVICPPSLAINTGDPIDPTTTGTANVTDNCDANPDVEYNDVITPGNCPGNYTISRTWTATDKCGNASSCIQTIIVQDVTPPSFVSNPATQISWCVKSIENAIYYAPTTDIAPDRPEYYILNAADKISLDINPLSFKDNGVINPSLILHWRIDFTGTTPYHIEGTGQPSAYAGEIRFEGKASAVVNHKISYWLEDNCGNISTPVPTIIKILPRPDIIKNTI